jgi:small redox-active disulfide protein 2
MIIEVCGTGCAKCHTVVDNVHKTVKEMGLKEGEDVLVNEVKDPLQFATRGVLFTPALLIDNVKLAEGKIPDVKEIKKWIEARLTQT